MFRVVIEHFETADEAVEFRNAMNKAHGAKHLAYIQRQETRLCRWLTWTFK